jgi:bifunctional UDP-N-acetylglucosamine pyrophosphorylase/glucosamine-1-phosphate N-acetyltransferase
LPKTIAVILAAGLGTRMKSKIPKVLHQLAGVPLVSHVLDALKEAAVDDIIIVLGYQGEMVEKTLGKDYRYVYQQEQLGTGHALLQALPLLQEYAGGHCLVLCGDTPLLTGETLKNLKERHLQTGAKATVLTAKLDNPSGYGRIIKGSGGIKRIVEERDATVEEKLIKEINTGAYCFDLASVKEGLARLTPANAQGEYYLTDIIKFLVDQKERVETYLLENAWEALGVNNRIQLAEAEAYLRRRLLEKQMLAGVTIIDPANTYIGKQVQIGQDTIVYPGVIMEGSTKIGQNCRIGPYTRLVDTIVGDDCTINNSILLESKVGQGCNIGPYSYLRPGTELADQVKVGDFAELKKSYVGKGSKIPHLSYIGDSVIGEGVNIGAGTITCNYDGKKKHQTIIKDRAFVGSNTNLVAPITVGEDAYIGAGSTVTKDIPSGALAIARGRQRNLENWQRRKEEQEASKKREE